MAVDIAELRREAESGSCVSQCVLGISLLYGYGVDPNYDEAFRWLSSAAKQGASRAVLNLGYMYAEGLGIEKNVPEAIRLFTAVALPSDSSDAFAARLELARLHSRSTPPNESEARRWYEAVLELCNPEDEDEDTREARNYLGTNH